jgi:hypothetical protein
MRITVVQSEFDLDIWFENYEFFLQIEDVAWFFETWARG